MPLFDFHYTHKNKLPLAVAGAMCASIVLADEQPIHVRAIPPLSQTAVLPNSAIAQSTFDAQAFAAGGRQQAAAVQFGPVWIAPSLGVSVGHDSNITRAYSDVISSSLVAVSPTVSADLLVRGDRYTLGYSGNFARYKSSAANNFNTNELQLQAQNVYTSRWSSRASADLLFSIDPPGTTQRRESTTPDRYRQEAVSGTLSYGALDAIGRVEVDAGFQKKRYLNNRDVTQFSDLDSGNIAARFFYRAAPKTQTFIELAQADYNYALNSANQDSKERRVYAGVTWDATAKTTGILKLGSLNKDFSSATIKNFHGLGWDGRVRWLPFTYSMFEVQTARSTSDSTGVGDYLINRVLGVSWKHDWNSYVTTNVGGTVAKTEFVNANRNDTVSTFLSGVEYRMRRWLTLGIDYRYEHRGSTDPSVPYNKNYVLASINATL